MKLKKENNLYVAVDTQQKKPAHKWQQEQKKVKKIKPGIQAHWD